MGDLGNRHRTVREVGRDGIDLAERRPAQIVATVGITGAAPE